MTQVFIGVVSCSFFASGDPVPLPTVLEEESLAEPTIHSVDPVPEQLTYRIIDDGTIHRKKKLIDSRGFTYNVKERGKETTYWQCTVRPKGNYCRATVKERNGQFVMGKQSHNHPPCYRCRYRHQDCRCCEGAGVTGCFQAGLCNRR